MQGRGAILRVALDTQKVSQETISPDLCRKFIGGQGINSWLLWQHFSKVTPHIDPRSADNVLIAGVGPLGATGFGAGTKTKWTFKSPLTGIFGDSISGGLFGARLRWAGYDHLVITGKAKHPVYIWIDDDSVEIRDATYLWGKNSEEVDKLIKEELGDAEIEVACIGRAGENLVASSCIMVSKTRAAGRVGGGCLMGSKNLKAIAVRGTRGISINDPQGFEAAIDDLWKAPALRKAAQGKDKALSAFEFGGRDGWKSYGTLVLTESVQRAGYSAFRNLQGSLLTDERFDNLNAAWYAHNVGMGTLACSPGCITGCSGWYRVKGNESPTAQKYAAAHTHKPEYSAIASFGIMSDVPDMVAVGHFNELCNEYGLDVIDAGSICGFLMELWQREIITEADTTDWFGEPVRLEWGNHEAVEKLINSMALQNNKLGLLIKDGLYKAAQRIEEMKETPVLKYAIYGKGGSPFICDVRHFAGCAVTYSTSSRGCDHLRGFGTLDKMNRPDISMLYFGTPKGAEPLSTTLKGASAMKAETRMAVINSLGLCVFVVGNDPILYPIDMFREAMRAATSMDMSTEELWAAGERVVNIEKAFNSRLGLRREDDKLCERWMKEPVNSGPGKGWKAEDYLEQAKDEYYEYHGWDKETSLQTKARLLELGLEDVASVLEKENAVAL